MNKIKFVCVLCLLAFTLCGCSGFSIADISSTQSQTVDDKISDKDKYYKIVYADTVYYYYIYNKNYDIVKSDGPLNRSPNLSMSDEHTVKFTMQVGTGISTQWGYYYDVERDIFSDTFYSIFDQLDGKTAYREKDRIIVRDIFEKDKYYYEIDSFSNSLSKAAEPFVSVEFINDGDSIEVTYLSGDEYEEVTEIFELSLYKKLERKDL